MASVNKIILVGRLGRDPELREVGESKVCEFTLATSERAFKTKDGREVPERTEWHTVVIFGKAAESAAKYLRKGSMACAEGAMRYEKYTDKNGVDRIKAVVRATEVTFLDSKPQDGQQRPARREAPAAPTAGEMDTMTYIPPAQPRQARQTPPQEQGGYDNDDLPW